MFKELKAFIIDCKKQNFAFYCMAAYLVFEFFRPHTIYPGLDFLPWAQLSLILGLFAVIHSGSVKFNTSHFFLFCFVFVCYLACIYSTYPEQSYVMLNVPISWVVVVFVFSNSIKTIEQFRLILIIYFLIIFKMSLFGAKTWAMRGFAFTNWGIAGPNGWFVNSGELALLMVIFACWSFGYIASTGQKKIYYLAPITAVMTILGASSRGSQLAIFIVVILAAVLLWRINIKNIALFVFISWAGYSLLPAEQKERFESMGSDGTSESRLMYWEKGLQMLEDHPVIGIGFNVFPRYFENYYAPYITFEDFQYRSEVAHNTLIQVSSEMGYMGFITYILLVFWSFILSIKIRKRVKTMQINSWVLRYTYYVDLSMIGYLVGSFFMSVALYPYIYMHLAFQQALKNSIDTDGKGVKK